MQRIRNHSLILGLALAASPLAALAQEPVTSPATTPAAGAKAAAVLPAATPSLLHRVLAMLGGPGPIIVAAVIVLLLIVGLALWALSRRGGDELDESFFEPETAERSKYEQIMAEIQGISLRIQGGDSKGYYRKIEQLARIYLERLGHKGSRESSDQELDQLINGGALPPKQAAALGSIFERCRLGAEHEGQKQDISTVDLLRDLRTLIKQTEETTVKPAA